MATQSAKTRYPGRITLSGGAQFGLVGPFTKSGPGQAEPFYLVALEVGRAHITLNISRFELAGLTLLPAVYPAIADFWEQFQSWTGRYGLTAGDLAAISELAKTVAE